MLRAGVSEAGRRDAAFHNIVGGKRIAARQIDELIGLSHGLTADGSLNQAEVEFLQKWLAANAAISAAPILTKLYRRVNEILHDGVADAEERADLLSTLVSETRSSRPADGEARVFRW